MARALYSSNQLQRTWGFTPRYGDVTRSLTNTYRERAVAILVDHSRRQEGCPWNQPNYIEALGSWSGHALVDVVASAYSAGYAAGAQMMRARKRSKPPAA
jgi:hypothetical protein